MAQSSQSAQQDFSEVEKTIRDLGDKYNQAVEELEDLQEKVKGAESDLLETLQKLRLLAKSIGGLDKDLDQKYVQDAEELEALKKPMYKKQTECFIMLQKLRNIHSAYLVNIINTKQAQINELKVKVEGSSTRADNLA